MYQLTKQDLIKKLGIAEATLAEAELALEEFELDESMYVDQYDDMLDQCYEGVFDILPSRILKECDPIAYNCGLSDFVDSLDKDQDSDYQALVEQVENIQNEVDDLEEQIAEREEV